MRGRKPVTCAADGCVVEFEPYRSTQLYCSQPCKNRAAHARNPCGRRRRAAEVKFGKKAAIRALKEVPCADCGGEYPYYVMDFDHVRGEKCHEIGRMLTAGFALATILAEAEKCDVVCANCHRTRTFTREQH